MKVINSRNLKGDELKSKLTLDPLRLGTIKKSQRILGSMEEMDARHEKKIEKFMNQLRNKK